MQFWTPELQRRRPEAKRRGEGQDVPSQSLPTNKLIDLPSQPLSGTLAAARVERWPSGRRRTPAKGVRVKSPSRVRIPPSPPIINLRASQKVSKITKTP